VPALALACCWALSRLVTEGLVIFLLQQGVGWASIRRSSLMALAWAAPSLVVRRFPTFDLAVSQAIFPSMGSRTFCFRVRRIASYTVLPLARAEAREVLSQAILPSQRPQGSSY
jgi:hypothetical protein